MPAIITEYFGKQRAVACGISYAGSSIGAFIFPLFIQWQLNQFGLEGTLLMMGAMTMHGLIGSLLLRPIQYYNNANKNKPKKHDKNFISSCETKSPLIESCDTRVYLENVHASKLNGIRERPKSIADFSVIVTMRDHRNDRREYRNRRMSMPSISQKQQLQLHNQLYNNTQNHSCDNQVNQEMKFFKRIQNHIKNDAKIFCNLQFNLCTFIYVVFIINFVSFLIILPDFAKDRGLTVNQGTLLLSLFSVTDFFGRILPGWASYFGLITNKNIYVGSIGLMGVCFILMPMADGFSEFVILTLLCGFFTGCQMVLPPVVISEYFGVERTAVAWGLANFVCGSISMAFRPILIGNYIIELNLTFNRINITGAFKDGTGHYDKLFYTLGSMALFSAILFIFNLVKSKIRK